MRLLIGMDDTDNMDSVGTGELLESLCRTLTDNGLGRGGFITRHQLYIHENIPYTSHNSAVCCDFDTEDIAGLVDFCRSYMDEACAEGADPGLCIIDLGRLTHRKRLIRFGYASKDIVLNKRDATEVAQLHGRAVYLSEHGGSGVGIVGALAACGLRLSGYDGTLRGKLKPPRENRVMTIGELCRKYALSCAMTREQCAADCADTVHRCCPTKAVLHNHKPAVYLAKDRSGKADWCVFGVKELNDMVD
jgi:hypothetical protein